MVTDPSRRDLRAAESAMAHAEATDDLPPEVEQTWQRPRGNRYPEIGAAGASHAGSSAEAAEVAESTAPSGALATSESPDGIVPAASRGRRASAGLDAEHAAAERIAEAEQAAADRRAAIEARTADERLAADRAAVAAQAEALRQAAARNRAAAEAVRPAPSITTPPAERVRRRDRPPAERRVLAAGVFAGDAGPVEPTPTDASQRTLPAAAAPAAVDEGDDVATRAIAIIRTAGPVDRETTSSEARRPARTLIMGILNVTPDSFSDGGEHDDVDRAVAHAVALVAAGADIIDVGGESTRPGAPRVGVLAEQRRVVPVIRELVSRGIRVSIDTMNAATAFAAAEAGADIINDVSGGLADPNMAQVAADTDRTFIAMHWRGHSDVMNSFSDYGDVVSEVKQALFQRVAELVVQGVDPDRLVIDPGLGFSKRSEHNWRLLAALHQFHEVGLPVLVAASRKRFLADLVPAGAPFTARDPATAVISALSAQAGAWAVRVHDVASTRAALDVQEAWKGAAHD